MRQDARQSISTDKPATRACEKFRPLFLTHFGYPPAKILDYLTLRTGAKCFVS
jgi:hypothetical protein